MSQNHHSINFQNLLELGGIQQGMVVADLGCGGHGKLTFVMAKLVGNQGLVYGVDIIRDHLQLIEKRAKLDNIKNVKVVWSDLELVGGCSIETSSVDFAALSFVLHQSEKYAEILREAFRLIKKNGKLIVLEWNKLAALSGPDVNNRLTKDQIEAAANKAGFKTDKELIVNHQHFGLIFIK